LGAIIIILLAVLGAALGSFFNVLIYRLPRKESIVFPASHCGECKQAIPFYYNIPIISYLMLGGKCKHCGARIHWHHLLVEIITPLILIGVHLQYGLLNVIFVKYAILALWMFRSFSLMPFIRLSHTSFPSPHSGGSDLRSHPSERCGDLPFLDCSRGYILLSTSSGLSIQIGTKIDGLGVVTSGC
jgi:hypothetical protein